MFIYKVTNLTNNKIYIGKTIHTLETRKLQHIRESKKPTFKFHRALKKYGIDNFSWEVIFECNNEDDLNNKEVEFIQIFDSYNNGYNMTLGGDGVSGRIPSIETRNLWSRQRKGKVAWNKGLKNINAKRYNRIKKERDEINNAISHSLKGRIPWNKGKLIGNNIKTKGRIPHNAYQVIQIDINGIETIWYGFSNIEKTFHCSRNSIYKAILNNSLFRESYWKTNFDIQTLIRPVKDK